MYLKLKHKLIKKKFRKRTWFWVSTTHILALLLIFIVFCFKGCVTAKRPSSIRVNIVTSASQAAQSNQSISNKKVNQKDIKKIIKSTLPKKKWKALDPSQINKSISTITKIIPHKKNNSINNSEIASNIRQQIKKISFTNSYAANTSVLNYYDEVSQFLYSKWEQPARTAAHNGTPVVKVRVSLNNKGTILSSSIVSKSGIISMDSSVLRLLSTLSALPPPPEGAIEFDIYLELQN